MPVEGRQLGAGKASRKEGRQEGGSGGQAGQQEMLSALLMLHSTSLAGFWNCIYFYFMCVTLVPFLPSNNMYSMFFFSNFCTPAACMDVFVCLCLRVKVCKDRRVSRCFNSHITLHQNIKLLEGNFHSYIIKVLPIVIYI